MGARGIFREQQCEAFVPLHPEFQEITGMDLKVCWSMSRESWSCRNKSSPSKPVLQWQMELCLSLILLFCLITVADVCLFVFLKKAPLTKSCCSPSASPGGCLQNHIIMYHHMILHAGCRPCAAHDVATTTWQREYHIKKERNGA